MAESPLTFRKAFESLTDHRPFPWQERLFDRFMEGDIPPSCNLPTGLGKTHVVTVWLIAVANGAKLPRRVVYVVNRRTVVDQTTAEIERIRSRIEAGGIADALRRVCRLTNDEPPLAISTLRGQFADNREWSANPSRPAVICGTVDMIGSRLLFSGYGIGFKSRPLHAGFLGQDVLLVHDEAHLEPAFQKLITDIEKEQTCERKRGGNLPWLAMRVMELTATTRNDNSQDARTFSLTPDEQEHPVVKQRLRAPKQLHLTPVEDDKQVAGKIAEIAAGHKDANAGVLVFVRTLDAVGTVEKELKKTGRPIVLLTGTIRGKERDDLVKKPGFQRFLKGAETGDTVYLICTSAGEVGIDISANHMACDLSTFESMVQRFGRVNRYGGGEARIDVVYPASFGKTDKIGELKANEIDKRRQRTLDLFRKLPETNAESKSGEALYDASPEALMDLWQRSDLPYKIEDAFSPKPAMLDTTDILLDAWALTSITDDMPGRPEVAPYLHGIADDLPQTTIAWRSELDLIDAKSPDAQKTLQAIFTKHRIRPHEMLTVAMTNQRGKWKFRAIAFLEEIAAKRPDLRNTRVAIQFARSLRLTTISDLIDNPGPLKADLTLVLPATFGGLDDKGMLSADAIPSESRAEDAPAASSLDIGDVKGYERETDSRPRLRVLIERSDDGWMARAMPGADLLPDDWNLEEPPERSTLLVNHIQKKSGLKVRLVQPLKWDEEDDPVSALVCLSPPPKQQKPVEQTLHEHVATVEKEANRLADALLGNDRAAHTALRFAAKWHDEGKNAPIWQRYIGGPNSNGEPLAKSAEWRDPKLLAGYRHEFGSLLRIAPRLPDDEDVRELAMHLIAAHHGYARPHFRHTLDRDFTTQASDETHIDVVRRFARLQRRYGRWGLAYLESLFRAADWAASGDMDVDDGLEDRDGGVA